MTTLSRNITGTFNEITGGVNLHSGAITTVNQAGRGIIGAAGFWGTYPIFKLDVSRVVPTSTENRPVNVGVKYIIKAE